MTAESNPVFDQIDIGTIVKEYSLSDFNLPHKIESYDSYFGIRKLLLNLDVDEINGYAGLGQDRDAVRNDLSDLCRLHWICLSRRCINVLEIGSGYSTAVLVDAMSRLSQQFRDWVSLNLRCDDPFHVYSVEEDPIFLDIITRKLAILRGQYVTFTRADVNVHLHDGRFTTQFSQLPNVSPDLIYLDGPSRNATCEVVRGFSFNNIARMPMSSDILAVEFFLEPGTLIMVDGRGANARFLQSYLKRKWVYFHDQDGDCHYFELQEEPFGALNSKRLAFCLQDGYLIDSNP